jgi:nicotinate-nucleotide--dimethylbenzimidazole phosphoribosyltransferase
MNPNLHTSIEARWNSRTKPPGSLGRLETLAADFCRIREQELPPCNHLGLYLFAADHGITAEGISAYPSAVTAQMVKNFESGGAAVNVLAREHSVAVHVIDAGVGNPTRNFMREPAMTIALCEQHLQAGRALATQAASKYQLVGVGEMGIGNTTTAAALFAAYTGLAGAKVAGRGTGLDAAGVAHKAHVIDQALALHQAALQNPTHTLAALGGFEIAQIAGFLLGAADLQLPVMLDGFITCAAALAATRIRPSSRDIMLFSHRSAEHAHGDLLTTLNASYLLDLGMRLGEGTGAILGMQLTRSAMRLYAEMASFADAGVSQAEQQR